ncbi:MAG: hypothetical protein BHW10_02695 [Clostridium sp. CAG:307_30_263]|nr:MAG: hypothetical protein BHW10_02695 [Clostridium sp. CAG:307_30_263]
MKKSKTKIFWISIAIGCLIVFTLMLLSSVINIGERLRKIHVSVEIAFYVLVFLIVFLVIINPIRIILTSPSFEICTTLDPDSHKVRSVYRAVARNMAKNQNVDEEHRLLLTKYKNYDELQMNMTVVFHDCIKKNLNNIIIKKAKTVLISTAICQNARMDMITVFSVNLNMIKGLVTECGFRPNMTNLSKLTINVFSTALIAEGLESISIDDILPNSVNNALGQIPFIKPVMASVTQGIANALLTIRIGCVTRKYLFRDGNIITKDDIRKSAFKDSLILLPMVLYGTLTFIPKKIVHMFGSKNKENKKSAPDETLMIAD